MTKQDIQSFYQSASIKTADDLLTIATTANLRRLSKLTLPEIERLSDEVARVVPAGNIPVMILSGLEKIRGRQVKLDTAQKHMELLFQGVRQSLDEAVYTAFFAGPAAVIYGYQQLLRLAGKDVDSAFPDGTWQFYLEFALREDGARHANETTGFHQKLSAHRINIDTADMLASWVSATAFFLRDLPNVLAAEWYEQVSLKHLIEVANIDNPRTLYTAWEHQHPYARGDNAGQDTYVIYRQRVFEDFLKRYLVTLPARTQKDYHKRLQANNNQAELADYQRQLSWLAYLEPQQYRETRVPYSLEQAYIGIIWQARYYLLPITELFDPATVRATVAAILTDQSDVPPATLDDVLVITKRSVQPKLRQRLDKQSLQDIELLQRTPVLINWDVRDHGQPLATIRQGKRGVGDHALTIFRTNQSIVLDQSHIFFDGAWGAAVAEILTNEALSWAQYFAQLSPAAPGKRLWFTPTLQTSEKFAAQAEKARTPAETSAETEKIHIGPILATRKMLKQRSDMAQVTVNDLLILYRGLHALSYQPSAKLQSALIELSTNPQPEAQQALQLIQESLKQLHSKNPAILIPIDARYHNPRERLYPTTFQNPFTDFITYHQQALEALNAYKADKPGSRDKTFHEFYEKQRFYLRLLGGFGELLSRYKHIAMAGQSTSTATIQLLGHLPASLQNLLDTIPGKFDLLNEIIKGEEVFSNIGRVARGSTLRRFITAKDDNQQKTLIWGVLTDDDNTVHLSLRDFRPHVTALHNIGRYDLAQLIAQDYLNAYAEGLNRYIAELREITMASRETL